MYHNLCRLLMICNKLDYKTSPAWFEEFLSGLGDLFKGDLIIMYSPVNNLFI